MINSAKRYVALVLLVCGNALADTTWTNGTGSWETSSNWSGGSVPSAETATIGNGGTAQISSAVASITNLVITNSSSVRVQNGGSLNVTGGYPLIGVRGSNSLILEAGSSVTFATNLYIGSNAIGAIINNGGTLTLNGGNTYLGYYSSVDTGYVYQTAGAITGINMTVGSSIGGTGTYPGLGLYTMTGGTSTWSGMVTIGNNSTDCRANIGGSSLFSANTINLHSSAGGTPSIFYMDGSAVVNCTTVNCNSGNANPSPTEIIVNGGTLNFTNLYFSAGSGSGIMVVSNGVAQQSGASQISLSPSILGGAGTLIVAGGTFQSRGVILTGRYKSDKIVVTGGTLLATNINDSIWLGYNDAIVCSLVVSNGTVLTKGIRIGYSGYAHTGLVVCAGGVLGVGSQGAYGATTTSYKQFKFDGGVFSNLANANNIGMLALNDANSTVTITTNGAIVDSGGYSVGISSKLTDASGQSGWLLKRGAGTLFLTTNNTYSGSTIVSNGVLCITTNVALPSTTALQLPSVAGSLVLSNSTPATVSTLTIGGRSMYRGTWGATGMQNPAITGPGNLIVTNGPSALVYGFTNQLLTKDGKVLVPQ